MGLTPRPENFEEVLTYVLPDPRPQPVKYTKMLKPI